MVMVLTQARRSLTSLVQESRREQQWTDARIRWRGSSVPGHRFILATSSPVLHQILLQCDRDHGSLEADTDLVFDTSFDQTDVDQFLSYVYGLSDQLPAHLSSFFPSHQQQQQLQQQQLKPEIKPDIEHNHVHQQPGPGNLWDEHWTDDVNNRLLYDYDVDMEVGDQYDGPDEEVQRSKEECPYCGKFVSKLAKHVFEKHKSDYWTDFNPGGRKTGGRKKDFPKQCPHCDKQLSCRWHFDRHIKTHNPEHKERKPRQPKLESSPADTDPGPFICIQCGEEFTTKKAMKSHEYKHKNEISCEIKDCNEIFLSHLAYSNHMLFKHQKVIKRRKCHAKVKTGNDEEAKKKAQEEKKHLCTECGRGFREADSLKKHYIFVHTERAIPTCVCNVCGKKFKTNNKLKNHMLLHEPPTLPCPFCDKLFETDHKVKKHIKSTHVEDDQKLYQCTYCQKGFSHFPSYESHMNSHKNIRPYQCHLCDNAYQNHFNLQQHVKKNHGVLISSNPHD